MTKKCRRVDRGSLSKTGKEMGITQLVHLLWRKEGNRENEEKGDGES